MTDRVTGYVVTLDHDIREDDAEAITKALSMVKGVLSVEPVTADPFAEAMYRSRVHSALVNQLLAAVQGVIYGNEK